LRRFGHDGQCTKTARHAARKIWIENTQRFHQLARKFFTPQEDDLNFRLYKFFFLLA
jgi:hypothetical protein